MKIDENMLLDDILDLNPEFTGILLRHGLNCEGCPGIYSESLREAADGHGVDLDKLLEDLNSHLNG